MLFRTTLRNCLLIGYYVVALETGSEKFPKNSSKVEFGQSGKKHHVLWAAVCVGLYVNLTFVFFMNCTFSLCKFTRSWCIAPANRANSRKEIAEVAFTWSTTKMGNQRILWYFPLWPVGQNIDPVSRAKQRCAPRKIQGSPVLWTC